MTDTAEVSASSGRTGIGRRLARHALASLAALGGVLLATFVLARQLPGDPASLMAPPSASGAEIAAIRSRLGLDRPLPEQLGTYVLHLAHGDLGTSFLTGRPVLDDLAARLPASAELGLSALLLALPLGLGLGLVAALRPGSLVDRATRVFLSAAGALPTFVSGLLLVYLFYAALGWSPDPTGRIDIFLGPPPRLTGFFTVDALVAGDWERLRASLAQLVLPAACLALFLVAPLARVTRAAMLAALSSDFVRMARGVGLPPRRIVLTYALRNAMLPILSMMGMTLSSLLGASVMVEKVFAWPGIASYAADALAAGDFAAVQGFVLVVSVGYVLLNAVIDALYRLADPRVSL